MTLPEFSVKRRITTLMVFLAVLLLGGLVFTTLKVDLLPEIEPPVINILTTWPGASASDVEQRVSKIVENQVSIIEGVDTIFSKSQDNLSVVSVKFKWGEDLDVKVGDIRDAVNFAKRDLPDDAEEPIILRITSGTVPVLSMSLTAGSSFQGLYHFADNTVAETLSRIPGVGEVLIYGGDRREIQVQLDINKIEALGLSTQTIIKAIESENINIPAGSMKEDQVEYYLRVPGRFKSVDELKKVIVGVIRGRPVYLQDVATIVDGLKETEIEGFHDGQRSVILIVLKNSDANTVEVSRSVLAKMEEMKAREFPSDVQYYVGLNTADFIQDSIKNLGSSLFVGILLVFIVTWAFLKRLPASLIICSAIPFSLIITFIVMGWLDYTINIFTLSALAVASGMVVDNSIVATDQIVYHLELGERRSVASVLGAREVQSALVASTLTTAVVLLPLAFISGLVGVFFSALTIVMVLAVVASLFVSLSFIPMMGSRFFKREEDQFRIHKFTERCLVWLEKTYRNILSWSLNNRKKVVSVAILLLVLTFWGFRYIGTELTPEPDTGDISITFVLPEGTRLEKTTALLNDIMAHAKETIPEATNIYAYDGKDEKGYAVAVGQEAGPNIGTVGIKLVPKKERNRSAFVVANELRSWLRAKPGIEKMTVIVTSPIKAMFLGSKPLNIEVYGDNLSEVLSTATRIKDSLAQIPGAVDITLSQKQNRPEVWVEVDREKAALSGVSTAAVAQTLRTYYYGYETNESYWEGDDDYPIRIRLNNEQRDSRDILDRLMVPSVTGKLIRLSSIASLDDTVGPPEIQRKNKQRYIIVEANVHGRSLGEVTQDARDMIRNVEIPHGVRINFGGEVEEQADAFRQMGYLVLLGVLLVYMVMAGQYEAYLDPFIIMFSIPFALTGVAFAYLLTGTYLSLQGLLGVIMLIGIVVNNAIVLVDYINLLRARGLKLREALLEAGERRLRPVLMTTLTTFFGMLPMAVSRGQGAELWQPLAISVMGGLLVSTIVTLVLVPVIYSLFEEKLRRTKRFEEGRQVKTA